MASRFNDAARAIGYFPINKLFAHAWRSTHKNRLRSQLPRQPALRHHRPCGSADASQRLNPALFHSRSTTEEFAPWAWRAWNTSITGIACAFRSSEPQPRRGQMAAHQLGRSLRRHRRKSACNRGSIRNPLAGFHRRQRRCGSAHQRLRAPLRRGYRRNRVQSGRRRLRRAKRIGIHVRRSRLYLFPARRA